MNKSTNNLIARREDHIAEINCALYIVTYVFVSGVTMTATPMTLAEVHAMTKQMCDMGAVDQEMKIA